MTGPIRPNGGVPSDAVQPVSKVFEITKDPPKKEIEKKKPDAVTDKQEAARKQAEELLQRGKAADERNGIDFSA